MISINLYSMKRIVQTGLLLLALITSCEEKPNGGDPTEVLKFESLVADDNQISPGETTQITAIATGYQLEYHWSATLGDILGSGAEVEYATSPCHIGTNEISCTVKDGNGESETKTVSILVE